MLSVKALSQHQLCSTSQKYHIPAPERLRYSSQNTSTPEAPYFISRNTPASPAKTHLFQMHYRSSLQNIHFQNCFLSQCLESRKALLSYLQKRYLTSKNARFHLQKCLSSRKCFPSVSRNVLILPPDIPHLISSNIPPLETSQLVSGITLWHLQRGLPMEPRRCSKSEMYVLPNLLGRS